MKKVALYCRKSALAQTNKNQKLRLLQYATERNLKFDFYEETESTRKTRPVKQELMQKLQQNKYKAVVLYRFYGWSMTLTELINDCKKILQNGIDIISICDNINFLSASSGGHFQIINVFADFDREVLLDQKTKNC